MLKINGLVKRYGSFNALDSLDLSVKRGEIFGFVGPNGAGKTTTMKIICGLLRSDGGSVFVDGIDAIKENRRVKDKIGYMPDFFGVYDDLKVVEYLEFYASIYGIDGNERKKMIDDLLSLVNLHDKETEYVDNLSRGMKQRLCLARSLVHNPELLILDEPASGMDPRSRIELKEILRTLREMGKTIIISSHILPELAELCTSVGIIDRGRMVVTGKVDEIMRRIYGRRMVKLKVLDDAERTAMILKENINVEGVSIEENVIKFSLKGEDLDMNEILRKLILENIPVTNFSEESGNLEDIFMKVTGGEINEDKSSAI